MGKSESINFAKEQVFNLLSSFSHIFLLWESFWDLNNTQFSCITSKIVACKMTMSSQIYIQLKRFPILFFKSILVIFFLCVCVLPVHISLSKVPQLLFQNWFEVCWLTTFLTMSFCFMKPAVCNGRKPLTIALSVQHPPDKCIAPNQSEH